LFDELVPTINSENVQLKRIEIKEFDDSGAAYFV